MSIQEAFNQIINIERLNIDCKTDFDRFTELDQKIQSFVASDAYRFFNQPEPFNSLAKKIHQIATDEVVDPIVVGNAMYELQLLSGGIEKQAKALVNQEVLYQKCIEQASKDGFGIAQKIAKYNFKSEEMRFKIFEVAIKQDPKRVIECIANFGIKKKDHCLEIAMLLALLKPSEVLNYVKRNTSLLYEENLFQILKELIKRDPRRALNFADTYPIFDEKKNFELTRMMLNKNAEMGKFFKCNMGIQIQDFRNRFAEDLQPQERTEFLNSRRQEDLENDRLLLSEFGFKSSNHFECLTQNIKELIPDENERLKLLMKAASNENIAPAVAMVIHKFEISDEKNRFLIAMKMVENYPGVNLLNIFNFDLIDIKYIHALIDVYLNNENKNIIRNVNDSFNRYQGPAFSHFVKTVVCSLFPYLKVTKVDFSELKKDGILASLFEEVENNKFEDWQLSYAYSLVIRYDLKCRLQNISEDKQKAALPLTLQIFGIANAHLRHQLMNMLFSNVLNGPEKELEVFEGLGKYLKGKHTPLFRMLLAPFISAYPDLKWDNVIKLIDSDDFKDFHRNNAVVTGLLNLLQVKESDLSMEQKCQLINQLFLTDKIGKESSKEITSRLYMLIALINRGDAAKLSKLQSPQDIEKLLQNSFADIHVQDFSTKYKKLKLREPDFLLIYGSYFGSLDPIVKKPVQKCFDEFLNSVLEGTFENYRYKEDADIHWKTVCKAKKGLSTEWQKGEAISLKEFASPSDLNAKLKNELYQIFYVQKETAVPSKEFMHLKALLDPSKKQITQDEIDNALRELNQEQEKAAKSKLGQMAITQIKLEKNLIELLNPQKSLKEKIKATERGKPIENQYYRLFDTKADKFQERMVKVCNILKSMQGLDEEMTIEDTGDFQDMGLLGTETPSCQSIYADPYYSKALLAYIVNPSNRAIVIKDKTGRILQRSLLRLLWDPKTKKPVLFLEKSYKRPGAPQKGKDQIVAMAIKKAKKLGIPLVGAMIFIDQNSTKAFKGSLESLGGRAPFDYVDSGEVSGIKDNCKFTIENGFLLYSPSKRWSVF